MARPVVSPPAEDLYLALGAFTVGDSERDWHLLRACDALVEAFVEPIAELVSERDGRVPWEVLFDPYACPAEHLPFLGQLVGVELESNLTEQQARDKIALPEGFSRGTTPALLAAVQRTLTGNQTVLLDERYTGSAYQLRVRTLESETPSDAVTIAAILTQKVIGTVLTFDSITGQDWDDLVASYADWDAVVATYSTWSDVIADLS